MIPKHESKRKVNLRKISDEFKAMVENLLRRRVSESDKVCVSCHLKLKSDLEKRNIYISSSDNKQTLGFKINHQNASCDDQKSKNVTELNKIIGIFHESPVKLPKIWKCEKYKREKSEKVLKVIANKILQSETKTDKYYKEIISQLKTKLKNCENSCEVYEALSILPASMPVSEICGLFKISDHVARTAKNLQNEHQKKEIKKGHPIFKQTLVKLKIVYKQSL